MSIWHLATPLHNGNSYAKDRHRVYCYEEVVIGADPVTFTVDEMTYADRDQFRCNQAGEKVACDALEREK